MFLLQPSFLLYLSNFSPKKKKKINLQEKCQTPLLMVLTPYSTPQAPWRVLPVIIPLPHHKAPCTLLSLFPFTLYLLKSSFSRRLLLLTRAVGIRRTLRNFS